MRSTVMPVAVTTSSTANRPGWSRRALLPGVRMRPAGLGPSMRASLLIAWPRREREPRKLFACIRARERRLRTLRRTRDRPPCVERVAMVGPTAGQGGLSMLLRRRPGMAHARRRGPLEQGEPRERKGPEISIVPRFDDLPVPICRRTADHASLGRALREAREWTTSCAASPLWGCRVPGRCRARPPGSSREDLW